MDLKDHDSAASMAAVAYETSNGIGVSPKEAAEAALFRQVQRTTRFLQMGKGTAEERARAADMLEHYRHMRVIKADRDNVAIERDAANGSKMLELASSGTRFGSKRDGMRDYVQDAKLALNFKKVDRLTEATAFARGAVADWKAERGAAAETRSVRVSGHRFDKRVVRWLVGLVCF